MDDKTGKGADPCLGCVTCYKKYKVTLEHALSVAGGVGLFFAFTLVSFYIDDFFLSLANYLYTYLQS